MITDMVSEGLEPLTLEIDPGNIPGPARGFIYFQIVCAFLFHATSLSSRQCSSKKEVYKRAFYRHAQDNRKKNAPATYGVPDRSNELNCKDNSACSE